MKNDYLIHYGILGMKWGVRKSKHLKTNQDKPVTKAERKRQKKKELTKKMAISIGAIGALGIGSAAFLTKSKKGKAILEKSPINKKAFIAAFWATAQARYTTNANVVDIIGNTIGNFIYNYKQFGG